MKELTTQNFEDFISSDETVIVEFGAAWCGPCKMLEPILESCSETYPNRVGKVDVDSQRELATKMGILNIPTIFSFKNGEVVERKVGVAPKEELLKLLS